MEVLKAIYSRRSIRNFSEEKISDEILRRILLAGMSGPSCVNARDWAFFVIRDRQILSRMAEANGHPARPLLGADTGILVCGDMERAFPGAKDYWVIDAAVSVQNMILAAHALGVGSVWLGTWPQMDRVKKQAELLKLPETLIPHSILALGYPADESRISGKTEKERIDSLWEENRVHWVQPGE